MIIFPTQSDEPLPWIVRIIVCGLKIIGLAPFSFRRIKNSNRNGREGWSTSEFLFSKMGLAYNILLSILILVMCASAIPLLSSMSYPNKSPITQAIDVAEIILGNAASCVIIISVAVRQKKAISIMNRLLEVDRLLSGITKHPGHSEKTSYVFLVVQTILNVLLWVTFWVTEEASAKSILDKFVFDAPLFVIHFFFVEYSIVLALVTNELDSLNKNLSDFQEFPNYLFRTPVLHNSNLPVLSLPTYSSQLATLKVLHNIRITLSEVSVDVADFFSLPILSGIGCLAVVFVSEIYYLVIPIVAPVSVHNLYTEINTVMRILVCFYPLILLSFNVRQTLKEAKLTGPIIHKALATMTRPEIVKELERFSFQLMAENLSITAYGFFSLDFTLIQSIFATAATYLVIIIQFMRSVADTSDNTYS